MKSVTLSVTKCLFSDVFPPVFENFHCGSEKAEHIEDLTPRHLKQTPITQTPPHIAHANDVIKNTTSDVSLAENNHACRPEVHNRADSASSACVRDLAYVFCESNTANAHVCF